MRKKVIPIEEKSAMVRNKGYRYCIDDSFKLLYFYRQVLLDEILNENAALLYHFWQQIEGKSQAYEVKISDTTVRYIFQSTTKMGVCAANSSYLRVELLQNDNVSSYCHNVLAEIAKIKE